MLYFTHLASSKCVQNNIVDVGDISLYSHISFYLLSPCSSQQKSAPSWVSDNSELAMSAAFQKVYIVQIEMFVVVVLVL